MLAHCEVRHHAFQAFEAWAQRGALVAGDLLEPVIEGIVDLGGGHVVHEAQHELPGLVGAEDLLSIAGFLRQIEAGDIDLHLQEGRLANPQAVQHEIVTARLHAIGELRPDALGRRYRTARYNGCEESDDKCEKPSAPCHGQYPLPDATTDLAWIYALSDGKGKGTRRRAPS